MSSRNYKCNVDGRTFATQQALAQHRRDSHSGKGGKNAQGGGQKSTPKMPMNSIKGIFSGSDLIATVKLTKSTKPGTTLLLWDINPKSLSNTRMSRLASVYTRWRPKRLTVEAVPGAGTFTPGAYTMGWVAEPGWNPGSPESALARVSTLTPNIMSTFGNPKTLRIPCDTTQKWYYVHSQAGIDSDHGMLVCVLAAYVGSEKISISFKLNWEIEFDSPDMPEPQEDLACYPDPQWIPIFTDSVSDWAEGKRLTFKHTTGGAVVPFHGIREGVIYQPAPGVKVPYYKTNGTADEVKYFSKMIGEALYSSAMVCHASLADAKEYQQKGGDVQKVLEYKQAGEWVTPAFPEFVGNPISSSVLVDLRREALETEHPLRIRAKAVAGYFNPSEVFRDQGGEGSSG